MISESTKARFAREVAKFPADQKQSAVMACLSIVQQEQGWVSPDSEQVVAEVLGMSQPAVSSALGRLRQSLGDELFLRTQGGMTPTPYALQLAEPVAIALDGVVRKGEFVATATGVEGSLVYAVSADLREQIAAHGQAVFHLDLLPDRSLERVQAEVAHPRGARSLSSHLKSRLGLDGIKLGLLHELAQAFSF